MNPLDGWRLIDRFDVASYQCGLRAGDVLALRKDLPVTDPGGKVVCVLHPADGTWLVLPTSREDPVVRLEEPGGNVHTWDDDEASVREWFEIVRRAEPEEEEEPSPGGPSLFRGRFGRRPRACLAAFLWAFAMLPALAQLAMGDGLSLPVAALAGLSAAMLVLFFVRVDWFADATAVLLDCAAVAVVWHGWRNPALWLLAGLLLWASRLLSRERRG